MRPPAKGVRIMQIVEHSIAGTRVAVLRLLSRRTPAEVLVFPMFHVAEPAFYRSVEDRLRDCDVLVVEGIKPAPEEAEGAAGGAPGGAAAGAAAAALLTLTYRLMPRLPHSGFVEDPIDYPGLGRPVVTPDQDVAQFGREWQELPRRHRVTAASVAPVAAVVGLVAGRRLLLSAAAELNDLPTRDEELRAEGGFAERLESTLLGRRDELAVGAVGELIERAGEEQVRIGVVYGAAHVRGIVRGLARRHGFRPRDAEWLTAIAAGREFTE
jgi:hypothetical protein